MTSNFDKDLVIIGGGPAGYSAAFRAADLGLTVALIEQNPQLGGVCLREGCIPTKNLLDVAGLIRQTQQSAKQGLTFAPPQIELAKLREQKNQIINKLERGLRQLAKSRKVQIIEAHACLTGPHELSLTPAKPVATLTFRHALIASGSQPRPLPMLPVDPRIFNSDKALALESIPRRLVVIGAGIIGLELSTIFQALGSDVTLIETASTLLPILPAEIVRPLERLLKRQLKAFHLSSQVRGVECAADDLTLQLETPRGPTTVTADAILSAAGRIPAGEGIATANVGISLQSNGAIQVDDQLRTSLPHIFAAGDVTGNPMLAHRATHAGRQIAELIAGTRTKLDNCLIPSVLYTDPEIAWVGQTGIEENSLAQHTIGAFPWSANGRSISMGRVDGLTRLVADSATGRLLGAQIVGPRAGELISELTLAIETGLTYREVARIIHPHPTLSETIGGACDVLAGEAIDLPQSIIARKQ